MKIYEDHSEFPADDGGYPVKNWEHPELWETLLPHDGVPRLMFRRDPAPVRPAADTVVHDLTLTEGGLWAQLDDDEIVGYFELLRRLSGSRGMVRCLEVPGHDVHRLARLLEKKYQFPELVARVERDTKIDQVPTDQVVADFAGSDFWLQGARQCGRQDELKAIQNFVTTCFEAGKVPVIRLLDASRGVLDQSLLGLVVKMKKMADEADLPVRIRLCDTLGLFHEHPAAGLPRGLPRLLHALTEVLRYPGEWIGVEAANDGGRAAAVTQAAWLHGASSVGVTLGGRGPRAGLASMEVALSDLLAIRADAPRLNLSLLRDLENLVTASGAVDKLPAATPLSGVAVFQPRVQSVADVENLSNPCDPALVYGVRAGRSLGAHSSRNDVVEWLRSQLGRGVIMTAEHPGVVKMVGWLAASGRERIGDKELLRQARRFLPGFFVMEGRP